jgi:DNA-binding SARP family transcriptional activator
MGFLLGRASLSRVLIYRNFRDSPKSLKNYLRCFRSDSMIDLGLREQHSMNSSHRLRVSTFGGLRIARNNGQAICLCTDRARALFLLLLCHRDHMIHREAICATLWPTLDERQARSHLSKSLWRLRTALDVECEAGRTAVVDQAECLIGLFAERIDADCWRLADVAKSIELKEDAELTVDDAQMLSDVIRDCQGTFCVGIFDEWCESYREQNYDLVLNAINRLIGFYQTRKNWAMAISWGRQAVKLDPLREDLHFAIMTGYRSMGNRALAIQQYRHCEHILASELQIAPSDEMRLFYNELA